MIRLRPRTDEDNAFIQSVTERELVPTLEQAWKFTWDDGHARKFMLDLLTTGDTLIISRSGDAADPVLVNAPVSTQAPTQSKSPDAPHHLAAHDEQLLGYVWYIIRPERRWLRRRSIFWINYLIVDGRFQGRGIGRTVINHCVDAARRAGCARMELWVQAPNTRARHFYEQMRFAPGRPVDGNIPMQRRVR